MVHKDKYQSFIELSKYEEEGSDYNIIHQDRESEVTIIAPHGGKIEPHTTEIAEAISGNNFNFYSFKGIKDHCNYLILHITSHRFDEPICVKLVEKSEIVIAIHGSGKLGKKVFIGGLNESLKKNISSELISAGYNVQNDNHNYPGERTTNICNRSSKGEGVQIELTMALRENISIQNFSQSIKNAITAELID